MLKANVPQILISSAAIFGISLVWGDFNVKVFHTVRDLLSAAFIDKAGEERRLLEEEIRRIEEEEIRRIDLEEEKDDGEIPTPSPRSQNSISQA